MDNKMTAAQQARRRNAGPALLKRRDNTVVEPTDSQNPQTQPQQEPEKLGPPQPPIPQLTPQSSPPQGTQAPQNQPQ